MPRESAYTKGRRLLVEGRLFVGVADPQGFRARIRGDSAMYDLTFERGVWRCTCDHPAASTPCSHIVAGRLVYTEPGGAP
jgi:hypothetical protein